MRKIYRTTSLALLSFVGVFGFVSCSSSDDASDEPNINPAESVKTSFTLSVALPQGNSNSAKPATRVADEIAQVSGNFRGIENITLIPFNTTGDVESTSSRLGTSNINLPNLSSITTTGNARVYNDVEVPLNTNHFLFYGKAIDQNSTAADANFNNGTLTVDGMEAGDLSNIKFTPTQIFTSQLSDNSVANALVAYLNSIVTTAYTPSTGAEASSWSAYASANSSRPLADLYNHFIQQTSGSSTSIEDAVQDLFTSLENLTTGNDGNNLTAEELVLRNAIVASITNSTYVSNGSGANASTTLQFTDAIKGYPGNINLPDGAATLSYDATAHFSENYSSTNLTRNNNNSIQIPALDNYVYPANLWYFVNTPVRTSEAALSDQYQNGTAWSDILTKYGNAAGSVNAATRSIALEKQIQYAVGRLQTVVKAGATTLKDRNGADVTVDNNTFPVTAVIIGGQRKVNWNFAPTGTSDTQYTMYDKVSKSIHATADNTTANNTLVLETPANEKINIVVELQNNSGKEFAGRDGMIPNGSKFYLVAELDPAKINGATINQVFKQDYFTTATLTINQNEKDAATNPDQNKGLGAAYNVIPDLRTPVLSIGMSVDLTWQTGLTFSVDM